MNTDIILIGKSHTNVAYTSALMGYGYLVNNMQTLDAARIMLRAGHIPRAIVVDLSNQTDKVKQFIQFVREEVSSDISMVVIGCNNDEADNAYICGANLFLYRPVKIEGLVGILRDELRL